MLKDIREQDNSEGEMGRVNLCLTNPNPYVEEWEAPLGGFI